MHADTSFIGHSWSMARIFRLGKKITARFDFEASFEIEAQKGRGVPLFSEVVTVAIDRVPQLQRVL